MNLQQLQTGFGRGFLHYKNLLFDNQEVRKTIGGRWVKQKETGQWMPWSSEDNGWMKIDWIIKREDWGRKRPVRKLIAHAKRWAMARGGKFYENA